MLTNVSTIIHDISATMELNHTPSPSSIGDSDRSYGKFNLLAHWMAFHHPLEDIKCPAVCPSGWLAGSNRNSFSSPAQVVFLDRGMTRASCNPEYNHI